jgi:hypothetical protein
MPTPVDQHKTAHQDLHSERGAEPGDRTDRARNPVIKVEDLAWLGSVTKALYCRGISVRESKPFAGAGRWPPQAANACPLWAGAGQWRRRGLGHASRESKVGDLLTPQSVGCTRSRTRPA